MSNSNEKMESLSATQPYKLTEDLSLSPRIKLLLVIHRSDTSVSPLDEWKFKNSIITFLKTSFTSPISVPQEDLILRRFKDLKKRKREDPVAVGSLFVRDLGFVVRKSGYDDGDDEGDNGEKKFLEWRKLLVEKMDGMEVSLEGVKFRVSVRLPISDDLKLMTKEWQEFYAFGAGSRSRDGNKEPDTIVIRGLPSRWFAEPRVSSKPSMLVTHTIFSVFGKIRNLNVAEDDDLGKDTDADDGDLISGLQCKVVVQFEQYKDFFNALKVLCSRSLQKEGSRMKADYEVTWDKDGFFQNARRHPLERLGQYNYEGPKHQSYNSRSSSRYSPEDLRSKRFKG